MGDGLGRTGGAGEWLDAPFDQADPQRVVCRFDVSSVFDDELDGDLADDGPDAAAGAAEDELEPT